MSQRQPEAKGTQQQTGRGKKKNPWALKLPIPKLDPLTENQAYFMMDYDAGYGMLGALGCPGSGKTFLATYKALQDLMSKETDTRHIKFIRSTVPVRDAGFLPGTQRDKEAPYASVYQEIVNEICNRGDAWELLEQNFFVSFCSTSFEQGKTYRDTTVILDECQNLTFNELDLVAGRLGEGSRIVFCGDLQQCYLNHKEHSGLNDWIKIVELMEEGRLIWYEPEDIVRSGLARSYILAREKVLHNA